MLSVSPVRSRTIIATSTDSGIDTAVTSVARTDSRNPRITRIANSRPSRPSVVRSSMELEMNGAWSKTVVLTATEFGRTARPNGTGGTDHGTATAIFVGGGAVDGKRVIANWPGLEFAQLYQNRDLAPTTDFRAVAKGVLSAHLAIPQDALASVVFPQSAGVAPMKDLLRAMTNALSVG